MVVSLGLRSGLFEVRYLVLSLPGLALLAAAGIVRLARHPYAALAVGLAALVPAGLGLSAQYFDPTLARDDYRGLVASIEAEARPTDVVVLSAPNQTEVFGYYYRGPLATVGLPAQRPIAAQATLQRLAPPQAHYGPPLLLSSAL